MGKVKMMFKVDKKTGEKTLTKFGKSLFNKMGKEEGVKARFGQMYIGIIAMLQQAVSEFNNSHTYKATKVVVPIAVKDALLGKYEFDETDVFADEGFRGALDENGMIKLNLSKFVVESFEDGDNKNYIIYEGLSPYTSIKVI